MNNIKAKMGLFQFMFRSSTQLSRLRSVYKPRLTNLKHYNVASFFKPYTTTSNNNQATAAPESDISDYLARYSKGDEILGFTVEEVTDVPELHLTALRLTHMKTGADYIHIARNDTNNTFSVAFRTPPPDDSGVCHILEHLALCGSEKFPCRDPFFKMLSRSLSTFMNAFTGCDYTMYPFSTKNIRDFNNLLQIYLDAAFFPNLHKVDFLQEGWRLEHEVLEDRKTPIIFKGVVFNEMKGVLSSSAYLFMIKQLNKLYPDNVYRHESGGNPMAIPSLTWENLQKYHQTYYHPSNARFYSYGSFPLEAHLENVDNYVLSRFNKTQQNTVVKPQTLWNKPREDQITCAPDPLAPNPDKQTTVSVAFALSDIKDTNESFVLAVLCNLLTDGSTAPFYQSLIVPGIGADYAPGLGFDGHNLQSSFSVGLCGIHENDVEKVKKIIEDTFDKVIQDGFPENRIEAILHSIELGSKHQTTKFGLNLSMSINPLWNHGGDPIESLRINKQVNWFRQQMADDPKFLQKKVKKYFQDNNHKLTLKMSPDPRYTIDLAQKETLLLKDKVSKLSDKDKDTLYEESLRLAKEQANKEDVTCLPTLLVSEVEPTVEKTSFNECLLGTVPVSAYREATNGVVYFRGLSIGNNLPNHLTPYLPLFCNVVTSMGTKRLDYEQQDEETALVTGGLSASVHLAENPTSENSLEKGMLISSHCLERNVPLMFNLWNDIFDQVRFEDTERLAQLIHMEASDLVQGLTYKGHSYAMKLAGSNLTAGSHWSEKFFGLTQIEHYKALAELENFQPVVEKLREIATFLLTKNALRCSLHTTPKFYSQGLENLETFLSSVPANDVEATIGFAPCSDFPTTSHQTHFCVPAAVNFVAKASNTVTFGHPDFASLRILSKLLSRKFLHREIREQGGAYGSGALIGTGGVFTFYSYRDPNVSKTLDAFQRAISWAQQGTFTAVDVDEAKLGVFSEIDHPVAAGDKGLSRFINGITDSMRQEHKNNIFRASKDSLVFVTEKYLSENAKNYGVAVIGPENDTCKNNQWKIISK